MTRSRGLPDGPLMPMKRGVTIRWPEGDATDFISPDRTCFMVWRDQFGTVHAAGWGREIDVDSPEFDQAVEAVLDAFDLPRGAKP